MPAAPRIVLILGSAPNAVEAQAWPRSRFTEIVAINNAWAVRPDWSVLIHPEDFPADRHPPAMAPGQRIVSADAYVPLQNRLGGFVYAGGTMAFTAGYWALEALRPQVLAFMGCDMVYTSGTPSHFYGTGRADPLRPDVSLRNLEAKSARLALYAARRGCACVNLSTQDSRLVFPRARPDALEGLSAPARDLGAMAAPEAEEARLGYFVASGRYWEHESAFDPDRIDRLDAMWLAAWSDAARAAAA